MTISRFSNSFIAMLAVIAAAAFLTPGTIYAQSTTSSIRVVVTDDSGASVGGVAVTIRHLPTSRTVTVTTTASGVAIAQGLAVGGPYEVGLAASSSYSAITVQDVMLNLDETEVIPLQARAAALDNITVTAKQIVQELAVGVGTSFDRATIDATPSISRDFVSVLARDPKILVDNSVARGPAVSMAGQNFRFNSVTIDGIPQNDNFGLNKNASATSRTPISIDAVEAVNANIAPYDVSYGNFVGGNINIVTKSGTNEFHGSV